MKKILLLAGVACLFSAQAGAESFILNPYISARAKYSFMDNNTTFKAYRTYKDGSTRNESAKDSTDDNVFGGSFALGLRTQLIYGALRNEFEYTRNADAKKSHTESDGEKYESKLKSEAFMFNTYYDIETNSPITPYIGAGLGVSRLKYSESYPNMPEENGSLKHSNFAWQVGAGVAYDINRNLALDLGYRYMDYGHFNKTETDNNEERDKTEKIKVESKAHEILLGLRYTF